MATRTSRDVRTVYYVADAGYWQGYTGADHLLPDHHGGMVGRAYGSRAAVQAELERRTAEPVPAYAEVWVVRITDRMARDAWAAVAAEADRLRSRSEGDYCRRLAAQATARSVRIDGDRLVCVSPPYPTDLYGPLVAPVGRVADHRTETIRLRA